MVLHMRLLAVVTVGVVCAALAGCPPQPVLFVTPLAIDLGTGKTTETFRITNTGGGTLTWSVSEDLPWLSLSRETPEEEKQGITLTGETTGGMEVIKITADRTVLGPGVSRGTIAITSNGGNEEVLVSISQPAVPMLDVNPRSLDLGTDQTASTLTISNMGLAPLEWSITVPPTAPWLSVTPRSGVVTDFQGSTGVEVTVNRQGLAAGDYTASLTVTSNDTDLVIPVTLRVVALSVSPGHLGLGTIRQPANSLVAVANNGAAPISYTATANDPFLTVTPASGDLPGNLSANITVTVNPAGLAPGGYTGSVTISADGGAISQTVSVAFAVSGFSVSTALVNFGQIEDSETRTFTITNTAPDPVNFSISVPPAAAQWLSVSPRTGALSGQQVITVTADPTRVAPGAFNADLRIEHDGLIDVVGVSLFSVEPPTLVVVPSFVDFDTTFVERQLTLWNSGSDTVAWRINTADFPAWLSLTPVVAGVASGSVAGDENAILTLRADRSVVQDDETDFEFTFTVEAVSGAEDPVEVRVHMAIPRVPELTFEADGVDIQGRPTVSFPVSVTEKTVRIANDGNGPLFWSITGFEGLNYILSVSPSQGTLDPGAEVRPTITVTREGLTYLGAQPPLLLTTNDPLNLQTVFIAEIQVAKQVLVIGRPGTLAFGRDISSDIFEVANGGDPDEIMDFRITTSKEWLSVFPETGSSVGTAIDIKDWQTISVSVDRSLLEEESAAAQITVTAFTVRDGEQVPVEGVEPLVIPVSVEVPTLSIETAFPRLRVPSLVRTVLLLRNLRSQPIKLPTQTLNSVAEKFTLIENGIVSEITESSKFLAGPERIRGNVLILLDYSGSMQDSAGKVLEPAIADAPNPLQALYDSCIPQLIDSMPANYRIALAVMNERSASGGTGALRQIFPSDGEPFFSANKAAVQARYDSIAVIDNGATVLLPALQQASRLLSAEDQDMGLIPFDDADVKALICVTDGRLTTNDQLTLADVTQELQARYVRFFPIGWGQQVFADPLVRIAVPTGGHFYATRTQPTTERDSFGNLIRLPIAETMQDWCIDSSASDPCDQSLGRDLASQVILSYVTLRNETSVNLTGRLSFNDPTDQISPCIDEQGDISGSFTRNQLNYAVYDGDPRLGQLSLRTEGIADDGTAEVVLRLEYMPRNVSQIVLDFGVDLPAPFTVSVTPVPNTQGGAISTWNVTPATVTSENTFTVTLSSPDGTPLRYADFGDLIRLRFAGINAPFSLTTNVTDPVFSATEPDQKFFVVPPVFLVGDSPTFAPAFPQPVLAATPAIVEGTGGARRVNLGTDEPNLTIDIYNGGGYLEIADTVRAVLDWTLEGDFVPGNAFTITPLDSTGTATDIVTPSTVVITPNRRLAPGTYSGDFIFRYQIPISNGLAFSGRLFTVSFVVLEGAGMVSTNSLDFGTDEVGLEFSVTNTGQGTLGWSVPDVTFPPWLSTTLSSGNLGPAESNVFQIRVDRSVVPPNSYTFGMPVNFSTGLTEVVQVMMTVP
jgi:hypothetical protein